MGFGSSKKILTENQRQVIDEQMNNSMFKISINGISQDFGFLCLSPKTKKKY